MSSAELAETTSAVDEPGTVREVSPRRRFFLEIFYLTQLGIILGAIAGVVWGYAAPRSQITAVGDGKVSYEPLSSAPIGANMTFMLIACVCAAIFVFVSFKIAFSNLVPSFLGVLIGSFLGTLALYLVGSFFGNSGNVEAGDLAVGQTTDSPLVIDATGVFFVWPFWAALLVAIVCWSKSRAIVRQINQLPVPAPELMPDQSTPSN